MSNSFKSLLILLLAYGIRFFPGCSDDDPISPPGEHFEAIGVYLHDSGIEMASILRGVTVDTLFAPEGGIGGALNVQFYDENENIINPPTGGQTLRFEIGDTSIAGIFQHPGEEGGFEFHLRGKKAGITNIELFIVHGDHDDFRSGKIPVKVADEPGTPEEPFGLKLYDKESERLPAAANSHAHLIGLLSLDKIVGKTVIVHTIRNDNSSGFFHHRIYSEFYL